MNSHRRSHVIIGKSFTGMNPGLLFHIFIGTAALLIMTAGSLHAGHIVSERISTSNAVSRSTILEEIISLDRSEARIELESLNSSDLGFQDQLNGIARLWNRGETAAAIASLRQIEGRYADIALGISRLTPQQTGRDNAVSAYAPSSDPNLDCDTETGNIFTAIKDGNDPYKWRVYRSVDGGRSWTESFSWNSTVPIIDIGAAVVGDYFYICYLTESHPDSVRVRRTSTATGQGDTTYFWHEVFNDPVNVSSIDIASNQEANNNRLYLFAINSGGELRSFYTDEEGGSNPDLPWTELNTGVSDAAGGLDLAFNDRTPAGTEGGYLFALYRTTADKINVFRFIYPFPANGTTEVGSYFRHDPRISAYRGRVVVVYTTEISSSVGAGMALSADSGATWSWEILDGAVDGDVAEPVVTLRGGGGVMIAYQRDLSGDDSSFFRAGPYDELPLSSSAAAGDTIPELGTRMDLEALPEGGPGLLSIDENGIPRFDRIPTIFLNGFELGDTLDWD